ncbi:MAG: GNAT family protein [Pseudomonadota bacterium]
MISLDFVRQQRPPTLEQGDIVLRAGQLTDHSSWAALRERSRAHLTRWEPDWQDKDATLEAFRTRLRLHDRLHRSGAALSLLVCLKPGGDVIGGVTLSDIRLHASHSATIGYWIGEGHLRQGRGLAAVQLTLAHAFGEKRLNRVEAACQPGNTASRALLSKAGFKEEGLARDYLFINGGWRDHLLFAATARDYSGAPALV